MGASLFVVFLLSSTFFAQAQQAEPAPAVTIMELEDLAAVIEDEAAREQLLSQIRTLITTRKNTEVNSPVESGSAWLTAAFSENVKEISRRLVTAADSLRDVPVLFAWVQDQAANPNTRQRWFDQTFKVALILLAGVVAEWRVSAQYLQEAAQVDFPGE